MANIKLIVEKSEHIARLKANLFNTDFKAIKFAEGELTEEEYAPIREERKAWRTQINDLRAEIAALKNK